ncbi:bifunctional ligase/repressor BirA [Clostridia bacterium]|nr:bifunctional ligase/repressor BirA [Clostridia bacterium]
MSVKEQILARLDEQRGSYLSGEDIAESCGLTRSAVWKTIKSLQKEGYLIHAITNKGYCLSKETDVLSLPGIRKYLSSNTQMLSIKVQKMVSSTNEMIRQKAAEGTEEGYVVVAGEQTGGRGRFGRSFYSPTDTGIYMSVLLRPQFAAERGVRITTAAAVAVCEAIEELSKEEPQIKWVNDIYVNGKKVCGILTEASMGLESQTLESVVLGIGINVYQPEDGFPEEIKDRAGAIFMTRQMDMKNRLAAAVLNRFFPYYGRLHQENFMEEYKSRSLVIGNKILVLLQTGGVPATALDLDDDCHLKVRYEDGKEEYLYSGEISIRV